MKFVYSILNDTTYIHVSFKTEEEADQYVNMLNEKYFSSEAPEYERNLYAYIFDRGWRYQYVDDEGEYLEDEEGTLYNYAEEAVVAKRKEYFSMKKICEVARVPYQSYKMWSAGTYKLNKKQLQRLIDAMDMVSRYI